jgi:preprotein translocase subunit SecE
VADRKRGGRSVDDDSVNEPVEDLYDEEDLEEEEFDEEEFDEDDLDEAEAPSKRGRAGAATRARTSSKAKTKARGDDARPGLVGRLVRRFRETVAELQKVIWPTRKELLTYTTVVIVFVALVMSYVGGLDVGFAQLMFLVFGHGSSGN